MAKAVCGEGKVITVFSGTSITSAATATSDVFDLTADGYFGAWYQSSPASAASGVTIYYEQSWDQTSANFVVPNGVSNFASVVNGNQPRVVGISPVPMPYIRFRATCDNTSQTDLTLALYLFVQ